MTGDFLPEQDSGQLANLGVRRGAHVVQQSRHEHRVLGEAADLLLGMLAAGVVGHQELAEQHVELVHGGAAPVTLTASSLQFRALQPQTLALTPEHRFRGRRLQGLGDGSPRGRPLPLPPPVLRLLGSRPEAATPPRGFSGPPALRSSSRGRLVPSAPRASLSVSRRRVAGLVGGGGGRLTGGTEEGFGFVGRATDEWRLPDARGSVLFAINSDIYLFLLYTCNFQLISVDPKQFNPRPVFLLVFEVWVGNSG